MTDPAAHIARTLADGRPRRLRDLARACAMDDATLDGALERLSQLGVALSVERDTVALPRPVDLLDPERIGRAVPRLRPEAVHVRFAVDSTNTALTERLREGAAAPEICTAEIQTAGRGRRGRRWISGLGQSLMLSVSWRFPTRSSALGGLSLAVGVALAEALTEEGFGRVMLKWPNDLVIDDRKLAGILVEAGGDRGRGRLAIPHGGIAGATASTGNTRDTVRFQAGGDRGRGRLAIPHSGIAGATASTGNTRDTVRFQAGGDRGRGRLAIPHGGIAGATASAGNARDTGWFQAGGGSGRLATCVVGVGFNLDLAQADSGRIDQPWTDFARAFGRVPGRNALAARAANAILDACGQYRGHGLAPFVARWERLDALRGRPVRILSGGAPLAGVARGIDADGALIVEHPGGVVRCEAGEVRVRARGD